MLQNFVNSVIGTISIPFNMMNLLYALIVVKMVMIFMPMLEKLALSVKNIIKSIRSKNEGES